MAMPHAGMPGNVTAASSRNAATPGSGNSWSLPKSVRKPSKQNGCNQKHDGRRNQLKAAQRFGQCAAIRRQVSSSETEPISANTASQIAPRS